MQPNTCSIDYVPRRTESAPRPGPRRSATIRLHDSAESPRGDAATYDGTRGHLHETFTQHQRFRTGSTRRPADHEVMEADLDRSLPRRRRPHRPRKPTPEDRLIARMLAPWLDGELAERGGRGLSKAHAARAQQLTSDRTRRSVALALDRLIERAENPRLLQPISPRGHPALPRPGTRGGAADRVARGSAALGGAAGRVRRGTAENADQRPGRPLLHQQPTRRPRRRLSRNRRVTRHRTLRPGLEDRDDAHWLDPDRRPGGGADRSDPGARRLHGEGLPGRRRRAARGETDPRAGRTGDLPGVPGRRRGRTELDGVRPLAPPVQRRQLADAVSGAANAGDPAVEPSRIHSLGPVEPVVQHRLLVRVEHQLAVLRGRDDAVRLHADGRNHGRELHFDGDRDGRGGRCDPGSRASRRQIDWETSGWTSPARCCTSRCRSQPSHRSSLSPPVCRRRSSTI